MKTSVILMLLMIVAAVVMAALTSKTTGKRKSEIKAKAVLTKNEQPMFFRLVEALPEHIVLAQVAFSALLTTKLTATRNTFDRKVADFVICKKTFEIVAIIELDDSSHNGRERQDESRDALMTSAGYKVLRYKRVPNIETLKTDLQTM